MKKAGVRVLVLLLLATMCMGIFSACTDYGYKFHFSVVGGNGEITISKDILMENVNLCSEAQWCELECADNSHILKLLGGKKGQLLKLIAIPDEGYQVKEWLFNGKVVEGNKTNSYEAIVTSEHNYNGVIAVVFEPIPSN